MVLENEFSVPQIVLKPMEAGKNRELIADYCDHRQDLYSSSLSELSSSPLLSWPATGSPSVSKGKRHVTCS